MVAAGFNLSVTRAWAENTDVDPRELSFPKGQDLFIFLSLSLILCSTTLFIRYLVPPASAKVRILAYLHT